MKRLLLTTLSLTIIITLPALADLGQVLTDFRGYSADLQNYLRTNFNKTFNSAGSPTQITFVETTGELNLPNPLLMGENLYNYLTIYSRSDRFENNPTVLSVGVENEINRLITLSSVSGILGNNGQLRIKNKLQNTEKSLNNINASTQQANNLIKDLQDLLLGITGTTGIISPLITSKINGNQANLQLQAIKIEAEQAKMTGEILQGTLQINQSLQYQNLNLANISQQIEVANRSQRVTSSAEAARLLRATTQMDLLGGKIER